MKTLKNILAVMPLLALLLAGCVITPPLPDEHPDPALFVAMAGRSACAGSANRLFVIDNRYVYWDRGASCQDQTQRLYGNTTEQLLCVQADSNKIPYTNCIDASVRTLFDTILGNRQAADLGLGARHTVTELGILPDPVINLVFATVARESFSAIATRRNVVVRNSIAWSALWAEHTANQTPAPALPRVDFNTQMLVAIFGGDRRGCHEFEIRRVNVERGQIIVDYEDRDITPTTICIAAITSPMHVVAVPNIDAQVVFNQIEPARIDFNTIDRSSYSRVQEPMNVVVRDMDAWRALWRRHTGSNGRVPAIDFSTTMVVAVFRGLLPNGCYSTEIVDVYRIDPYLNVARIDTVPGEDSACTLAIVTPAHLIAVPLTNGPVQFSAERRTLP